MTKTLSSAATAAVQTPTPLVVENAFRQHPLSNSPINKPTPVVASQKFLLGAADRTIWQDRLMAMEGVEAKTLVRLHGKLLAHE